MEAVSYDVEKRVLSFDFVDVTNLSRPGAYYSRQLEIVFVDDERIRLTYRGKEDGSVFPQVYSLKRKHP